MDETKPTSGVGVDRYGGLGLTLLDSLDALFLMGMEAEFDDAVSWLFVIVHVRKLIDHANVMLCVMLG